MMKDVLSSIQHMRKNECGAAAIEFAFIGTLLVFLTLGTFEMGRIIHAHHNLVAATGVVTRMVGLGASEDEMKLAIKSRFPESERDAVNVNITSHVGADGLSYRKVDAQFSLPILIPSFGIFPENSIPISAVQLLPG